MNEPFGFKVMVGGFATWFMSLVQGFDLTQVIGFIALVVGVFIQIVSYARNTRADNRSIEADDRAKTKHDLEMKVLERELQEVEHRVKNGT